ncbi:MAG: SDR family NAD(P)-dependent oxidoreductase [Myxococcota bacterium]
MLRPRHDNPLTATLAGLGDLLRARREGTPVAPDPRDRLEGRTALVTGANTGLGKAVAVELARLGARVRMACRSGIPEAGEEVKRRSGNGAVEMLPVDLSDLSRVHGLCDELAHRGDRLDVVVLNAGVVCKQARRSVQGLDLMFAVNFLANVVLTDRLVRDGLVAPPPGHPGDGSVSRPRILFVSSDTHRTADPIDFTRFGEPVEYDAMGSLKQYGHTKLLVSTYACELARRLEPQGISVHHLCPGAVNTDIARDAPPWVKPALGWLMGRFFRSPERAAGPVSYLAAARAIEGETGIYLHMETRKPAGERALDPAAGARLWDASHALVARLAGADSGRQAAP